MILRKFTIIPMKAQLNKIILRPWTLEDIDFSLSVRNHPDLMKWFRQNNKITYDQQKEFIKRDLGLCGTYNGMIIEVGKYRVGICGVKDTREFSIGILPEYQHKGIASEVMNQLYMKCGRMWSEVFVGNPALEFFISKCGFKIKSVKERAYHKHGQGLIDIVEISNE